MKRIYLTLLLVVIIGFNSFSQTTLTEDVNGVLNTNRIVAQTGAGQIFYTGHQVGTGYSMPSGIFRAWTDNPNGSLNYFYDGITNGITNYSVRADGQGYFAGGIGIGTSNPQSTLQVIGSATFSGNSANIDPTKPNMSLSFLANSGQVLVGWNRSAGPGETDFIANQAAGSLGGFAFYNHDNNNNETPILWMVGNGNVLIGKTSQTNSAYKLDINGNVRANEIVVNTTGADFVFDHLYQLPALSGLKKYIEQNHHLPEIASAKQMQADGLNVGDNQTKLLQKVEELTLYLIEKDGEIKDQSAQLKIQQVQINKLSRQVEYLTKKSEK